MDSARRDRSIGFLCLCITAFGWALNWPLMKLLLQQWPPLFARGLAGVCAALILAVLALSRGERLGVPREAVPRLLFATFTNVFAWMGFGTMAMKFVSVGEGALIAYTMPIWAMLFAWPVLHVRPTTRDVMALVLGIAGVVLILGGNGFAFGVDKLFGIALALSCAILFALGKPLMILCEQGIDEGVFFPGTASSFTHTLPANLNEFAAQRDPIRQVIKSWRAQVSATYKNVWSFAERYMQ